MDAARFDTLARALSGPGTRRRALGLLLGGGAALLGARGAAACRNGGVRCGRDGQCCAGRCLAGACACNRAVACKQPANTCKEAVCARTGKCRARNRPAGSPCASDGIACTRDVCDGEGRCTHEKDPDACCESSQCAPGVDCVDGACVCTEDVSCTGQCGCWTSAEGPVCIPGFSRSCEMRACTSSAECASGETCLHLSPSCPGPPAGFYCSQVVAGTCPG